MEALKKYLNDSNFDNEFVNKLIDSENIFNEVLKACNNRWAYGCGSYLFEGTTYDYSVNMFQKQLLLYNIAKQSTHALEIGTYIGHSLLIMLLANPKLNVITIDIDSTYSVPSTQILQKYFPDAKIHFLNSDSLEILPKIKDTFNLFHIDGHHHNEYITKEFNHCVNLNRGSIMHLVLDDVDCCTELKTKILNEHIVIKQITPNCKYPNCYFEINLSK
jgi:hypothetical protein